MNTVLIALGVGLGIVVLYYTIILLGVFIAAPLIMWAWNASIAVLFGLPKITMMQAFWMIIVSGLLLKPVQTTNVQKEK